MPCAAGATGPTGLTGSSGQTGVTGATGMSFDVLVTLVFLEIGVTSRWPSNASWVMVASLGVP